MLTTIQTTATLALLSKKVVNGIGVPKINGISRNQAVFLCAKSQFQIIMLSWVEQSKDWLGSLIPVRQFYLARHHNWRYVVGFNTLSTEANMPKNYAQEPTKQNDQTNTVSLKSIFSWLDSNTNLIPSSLNFEQAKPLSEHIQGSVIKFQAMVRLEVLL